MIPGGNMSETSEIAGNKQKTSETGSNYHALSWKELNNADGDHCNINLSKV